MRKRRQLRPNARYHVVSRINRQEMALNSKKIKELFLHTVIRAKTKYKFSIVNFCLMGNHVHFILQPLGNASLSKIMQWMLSVFAIRYNIQMNLKGHVWYDRFTSKIISDIRQFVRTFTYINQNPVKANLVKSEFHFKYCGLWHYRKALFDILDPPDLLIILLFPEIVFQQNQIPFLNQRAES